jgi:hypothetical protein
MLYTLAIVRKVAIVTVSCLLLAQLTPSIALACEGAAIEFKKEGNGKFNEAGAITKSVQKFFFVSPNERGNTNFECKEVKVGGELVANSTTATVIPIEYKGCEEAANKDPATITASGCAYKYSIIKEVKPEEYTGEMQIVNNGTTCKIALKTAAECKITVGGQGVAHPKVTYTNFTGGMPKELEIANSVEPLEYTVEEFKGCNGFKVAAKFSNGLYSGAFRLQHVSIK